MNIENFFTNRELAIFIYIISIFIFCSYKNNELIKSLWQLIMCLFSPKLFIWILNALLYTIIITIILLKFHYWELNLLKDTIIAFIAGIGLIFKSISNDDLLTYLKKQVITFFSVTYLLDFLTNSNTFNLSIELILNGIIIVFAGMKAVIEISKNNYNKKTIKFVDFVLSFIVLIIFVNSVKILFISPKDLFNWLEIKELFLPLIYTFAFIPLIFVSWISSHYETAFLRLETVLNNKTLINLYFKIKVFINFKLNLKALNDFIDFCWKNDNKMFDNSKLINRIFVDYKLRTTKIDFCNDTIGLNPQEAMTYLEDYNLKCIDYKYTNYSDGYGYYYGSIQQKISKRNYLLFSISGNQQAVQKIYLDLSINESYMNKDDLNLYIKCVEKIYNEIFKKSLPHKAINAIKKIKNYEIKYNKYKLLFENSVIPNINHYWYRFTIICTNPVELCDFELLYCNN